MIALEISSTRSFLESAARMAYFSSAVRFRYSVSAQARSKTFFPLHDEASGPDPPLVALDEFQQDAAQTAEGGLFLLGGQIRFLGRMEAEAVSTPSLISISEMSTRSRVRTWILSPSATLSTRADTPMG